MLARELMTRDPVTVTRHTRTTAALRLLTQHGVTTLPVTTSSGQLEGVVSELDLVRDRVIPGQGRHEASSNGLGFMAPRFVVEVMTPRAVTIRQEDDVAQAVELFLVTGVKSLPVVDLTGHLVGVLSRCVIVRALARVDDELAGEVDDLLRRAGLRDCHVEVSEGRAKVTEPGLEHRARLASALARSVPGVLGVTLVEVASDRGARKP